MMRVRELPVFRFAVVAAAAAVLGFLSPASGVRACPQPDQPQPQLLTLSFDLFSNHPSHRNQSSVPSVYEDGDARFTVSGTVDSVDYADNVILLSGPGGRVRIAITPTTAIAVRGESGGIADLRHGVRLTASGIIHNGLMTALAITIK